MITSTSEEIAPSVSLEEAEHDMDAVFELSDLMTVMVDGQHLITDVVDNIRANPLVQEAYLGNDDEVF